MNVGAVRIELSGGINRAQSFLVVLRPLVNFGQPHVGIQQARIPL